MGSVFCLELRKGRVMRIAVGLCAAIVSLIVASHFSHSLRAGFEFDLSCCETSPNCGETCYIMPLVCPSDPNKIQCRAFINGNGGDTYKACRRVGDTGATCDPVQRPGNEHVVCDGMTMYTCSSCVPSGESCTCLCMGNPAPGTVNLPIKFTCTGGC